MDSSKIQALFLVDCARSSGASTNAQWRNVCLSCVRTLLYLSKFPNREHIKNIQWNYKLYSSEAHIPTQLRSTSTQFQNVNSDNFETFFADLRKLISSARTLTSLDLPPIQFLYNALAASIQDYPWDAPEIASPVRRVSSRIHPSYQRTQSSNPQLLHRNNFVFICAQCPESEGELRKFCGVAGIGPLKDGVRRRLFPAPLLAKLEEKGISVLWIHPTSLGLSSAAPALNTMSELLSLTGGTLLPSTLLVGPTHSALRESSSSETAAGIAAQELGTPQESVMKVDSAAKSSPSALKEQPLTAGDHSIGVSPSLFPSSSFLEKYLRGQRSEKGRVELDASNGSEAFYWLSTAAGELLCILELRKMYYSRRVQLSPPSSHPPVARPRPQPAVSHSPLKRKPLHRYSLTAASSVEKRRRSIKKKLSFSQSSKDGSTKEPIPTTGSSEKTQLESMLTKKNIPRVVIVGVVKQVDVPLSFLCPASSCSCSSVYVPQSIRTQSSLPLTTRAVHSVNGTENQRSSQAECSPPSTSPLKWEVWQNIKNPPKFSSADCKTPEETSPTRAGERETPDRASRPLNKDALKSPLFNRSPQICLSKLPFTPPSRPPKRRLVSCHRTRSKSAPITSLGADVRNLMSRILVTVDVKRCVTVKACSSSPSKRSKVQRSVSMSPRYPVLRLKNMLDAQEIMKPRPQVQTLHPKKCLSERQFHSRQFQAMCVWLAKKGYFLVAHMCTETGGTSVGVLQPVSSLLATLTLVRPQHQTALFSKLVRLGDDSETSLAFWPSVGVAKGKGLSKVTQSNSKDTGNMSIGLSRSRVVSDPELMANVSLLLSKSSNKSDVVFGSKSDLPPFTNLSLLPWFSYSEDGGLNRTLFHTLSSVHSDCGNTGHSLTKVSHITRLRDVYRSRGTAAGGVYSLCQPSVGSGGTVTGEENMDHTSKVDEAAQPVTSEASGEEEEAALAMTSLDELRSWFQESYQEQVVAVLEQELKGDSLQKWASSTIPKFVQTFIILVANRDQPTNQIHVLDSHMQGHLWKELNSRVLVSGSSLGGKYDSLFKSLQQHGGNKELKNDSGGNKELKNDNGGNKELKVDSGGNKEMENDSGDSKEREKVLASQRVSEYLLQVFLRFEVMKACPDSCQDHKAYSDQLIFLLRKISLMSNPGFLGSLMKKIVLPLYIDSCKSILLEIYEGLMLPLPPDLDPDQSASEIESVGVVSQTEGTTSSEDEHSLLSMEEPLQAPNPPPLNVRKLARHTSFQEAAATQRQISVVSKPNKRKKNRKPEKPSKKRFKAEGSLSVRSSPRLSKTSTEGGKDTNRRGVCRNLFTRSHSVCEGVVSLKRRLSDNSDQVKEIKKKRTGGLQKHLTMATHVLVKETPVKKQVENYQRFKLQRLRSKSTVTSPDVIAIEESPRRSFYSKPRITRVPDSALFRTPPLKDHKKTSPTQLLLNKEPSPAALHSLLHGQILSPSTNTQPIDIVQFSHSKTPITESPLKRASLASTSKSPELFGRVPESPAGFPSLDGCVILGRTPLKSVRLSAAEEPLVTGGSVKANTRTARMLTYDNDSQNQKMSTSPPERRSDRVGSDCHIQASTQSSQRSESHSSNTCSPPLPREELTILDIPSLYAPHTPPEESVPPGEEVTLISPPESSPSHGCLLTGVDPRIENESASMMAFALCTPTKEDRKDFHQALLD